MDDQALLRRYCAEGDQEAFGELVHRHLALVYGAALRQIGDSALAEDATQIVFTRLAQRAHRLPRNLVLAGWLHADTRLTALQLLRSQRRRQTREAEAFKMQQTSSNQELDWAKIRPVLDEALEKLGAPDRDVLLLRFFEQRNLREVGAAFGLSEDAARMRVGRALSKLRDLLEARGIATAAEVLSASLITCGVQAAPTSLGALVTASALAASTPASGAIVGIVAMSKIKLAVIGTIVAGGVVTPVLWQHHVLTSLRAQNQSLQSEAEHLRLAQDEARRELQALSAEANRLRENARELAQLRGALARNRQAPEDQRAATHPSAGSQAAVADEAASSPEPVVTEAEIARFLQRPKPEQGAVLGQLRRQIMGQEKRPDAEFDRNRALAAGVRPKLEDLESQPREFADFQTAFIKTAIDLEDEEKVSQIHQIVEETYAQAVAEKLDARSRPAEEVEAWALRRDALDRQATHAVQQILSNEERARFDRAFLGVMGIDLGLNDGAWHRFVTPDGGVVFPSQEVAPLP